jgi:hypothetical protein
MPRVSLPNFIARVRSEQGSGTLVVVLCKDEHMNFVYVWENVY